MKDTNIMHIKACRNNFLIIVSNISGKVLFFKNSGSVGFKNNLKCTTEALLKLLTEGIQFLINRNKKKIFLKLDALNERVIAYIYKQVLTRFKRLRFQIIGFKIINRIPHNGCRNKI